MRELVRVIRIAARADPLARRFFPGQDPVGRKLLMGVVPPDKPAQLPIAGVVGDVRGVALDAGVEPEIYFSFYPQSATVLARVKVDPLSLAAVARRELGALDPALPVSRVGTLEEMLDASLARRRFAANALGLFSAIALALSAVGIYGLIAYNVSRRAREIGLRAALGARQADILRMVLGEGLALAGAGLVLGLAGALALTGVMRGMLAGVSATDPATLGGAAFALLVVALIASYAPARRASRRICSSISGSRRTTS